MRYALLMVILAAAPSVAQEQEQDKPVITLPSRPLPPLLLGQQPVKPPPKPYPDNLELSFSAVRLEPTDPFVQCGDKSFAQTGPGMSLRIERRRLFLELDGQFPGDGFRESRASATMRWMFLQRDNFALGMEIDYRLSMFKRRLAQVGDLTLFDERLSQLAIFGPTVRFHGPLGTTLWGSLIWGGYANEYDSVMTYGNDRVSQPTNGEHPNVAELSLGVRSAPIASRIRFAGTVRYDKTLRPTSTWTPKQEFSGDATLDVRAISFGRGNLYLGGGGRLTTGHPSLVTEKAFYLNAKLYVR